VKTLIWRGALLLLTVLTIGCGEGNPLAQSAPSAVLTPAAARSEKLAGATPAATAENIMWGESEKVTADNILWGDKAPKAKTNLIIWGE